MMKRLPWLLGTLVLCACADEKHERWDSLHYTLDHATHNYCNESDVACGGGKSRGGSTGSSIARGGGRGR